MKSKKKSPVYRNLLLLFSVSLVVCDWCFQFVNKSLGYGIENGGISFGFGVEIGTYLRFVLPLLLIIAAYFLWKRGLLRSLFLVTLLIGGMGNAVPRLIWGHVWDYLRVPYLELWINLSDVLISVSAMSYILVDDDRDTDRLRD